MLVELKMFLQEVVEILRSRFCRKSQHPRNPRAKNSKSSEFYFETLGTKTQNPRNFILKVTGDALRRVVQLGPSFSSNVHL
jgi:hypothetical protein